MYPRHRTQLEEFSTFVEFNSEPDSPPVRWRSDVRLSKNIIKLLESEDYKGVSTKVIALTFVKKIQEQYDTLIHRHLVAYLQKCCFKTCYSIYRDLKKNFPENLELEQLFLEANSFLLEKDIFDRYDFQSSAIETHITGIVKNKLLDSISKSLGDSSRRSIWSLLKEASQTKISKALDVMGIANPKVRLDYFNLIKFYKGVCASTKGLKEGDSTFTSMVESIVEQFNRLSDISGSGNIMTPEKVIEILKKCAQAIRQLDSVQREFSTEDEGSDVFDTVRSVQTFSSLDKLIDLVSNHLDNNLEGDLTNPSRKIMRINDVFILYHGLGYKDGKVGLIYKCDQATIWRFRSNAYSPILNVLRDWNSRIALKNFDDPRLLKILKEVLDTIYQEKLNEMLHVIGNNTLQPSDLAILSDLYELQSKRRYQSQNLVQEIANKQGVLAVHIEETIKQMQFVLSDALLSKLKEIFDSNLSIDSIGRKVYEFVESWIGISIQ